MLRVGSARSSCSSFRVRFRRLRACCRPHSPTSSPGACPAFSTPACSCTRSCVRRSLPPALRAPSPPRPFRPRRPPCASSPSCSGGRSSPDSFSPTHPRLGVRRRRRLRAAASRVPRVAPAVRPRAARRRCDRSRCRGPRISRSDCVPLPHRRRRRRCRARRRRTPCRNCARVPRRGRRRRRPLSARAPAGARRARPRRRRLERCTVAACAVNRDRAP